MPKNASVIPLERIKQAILLIRGQKVMLDADLAKIYGVTTKRLNEQVKRNRNRFPDEDFMFQVSSSEKAELVAICDRFKNLKHSTSLPYAFTEYGAIMLANILNSKTAVLASIQIVKTFIKMREMVAQNAELSLRLSRVEHKLSEQDEDIRLLVNAIRELMAPSEKPIRKIGF